MGRVQSTVVVEPEVGVEIGVRFAHRFVALQINFLVFHTAPQPLDKNVIQTPTLAVHRQTHAGRQKWLGELRAGKLTSLIGVEDLRLFKELDRPLHRLHAKRRIEGVGQFPAQHHAGVPIDHRAQVNVASAHRDIGDICRPYLVRAIHHQIAQQIRVYPMRFRPLREVGFPLNGC